MAEIELGLAQCGLYGHTTYFKSACLQLLRSCFSFSWSTYDICVIQERVRIELRALICPAKVKADACSIGGNTTAHMFIRTQSYVCMFACECVCAQCWCRYELLGLLAIVALFDILFAWYFCYVFYPAWVDRD